MSQATRYELRGPAAWIRLARPDKRNALNPEVLAGIAEGLDRAEADGARAVVLTGSGPVFCAGADLAHILSGLDDLGVIEELLAEAGQLTLRIESHTTPVIAAVNGAAVAGGLELVLACDLVVAADTATFSDGHVLHGLFPGAGSSIRLPRLIGAHRARHVMFTGAKLRAEEFRTWGVVNDVVPRDRLEDTVQQLCEDLARSSAATIARMKRVIRDGFDLPIADGLALELREACAHLREPDVSAGLAAFAVR